MPVPATPSSYQHYTLWDLSPGQFADRNEKNIPPGGAIETSNLLFLDGVIRPRPGLDLYAAPPVADRALVHIGQTQPFPPNVSRIMGVYKDGSNNLRIYERVGSSWTNRTPTGVISSGIEDGDNPQSCTFEGAWFFIGGNHDLTYLPSAGSVMKYVDQDQPDVALQPPDKPKILVPFKDRLVVADCINRDTGIREPGRVEWSDHQKPNVWGGGVGAGTSGGTRLGGGSERLTAAHTWSDTITIFSERSVFRGKFVGGQRSFQFDTLVDGCGCVAANTLVRFEEGKFIWMGPNNVYLARPNEIPQSIGSTIKNRIRDLGDRFNFRKSRAQVDRSNDLYWLVIPHASDSTVKKIFCCNLNGFSWWEGEFQTGPEVSAFGEFIQTPITQQLIGLADGNLLDFDFQYSSDNGQPFTCFWESGTFSGEELSQRGSQQVVVTRARAFSSTPDSEVDISISTCNALDEWEETDFQTLYFGDDIIDHTLEEKTESGEFFKFRFAFTTVAAAAHIQGISLSLIFGPDTR